MSLENRIMTVLSCYQTISLGELSLEIEVKPDALYAILHKMMEDKKITVVTDKATKQDLYTLNLKISEDQEIDTLIDTIKDEESEYETEEEKNPAFSSGIKVHFFPIKFAPNIHSLFNSIQRIHIIRVCPDNPDFIETDRGIIAIQEIDALLKKIKKEKKSSTKKSTKKADALK